MYHAHLQRPILCCCVYVESFIHYLPFLTLRIGIIIFFHTFLQKFDTKNLSKNCLKKYINIILHLYKRNELRINGLYLFSRLRETFENVSHLKMVRFIASLRLISFYWFHSLFVVHFSIRAKEHEKEDWKGQKFLFLCTERIYQISDASANFPWDHVA